MSVKSDESKNQKLSEQEIHDYELALVMYNLNKHNSEYINTFLKSEEFNALKQNPCDIRFFLGEIISRNEEGVVKVIKEYKANLNSPRMHFDEAWKDILPTLLHDILKNFCPDIYGIVDWTKQIEDMNAELLALLGGNSALKRTADRVFKLFLKEGLNNDVIYTYSFGKKDKTEHYALLSVHIDVQNKKVINFGKRMHTMAYRLIDKSDLPVYSIAIT